MVVTWSSGSATNVQRGSLDILPAVQHRAFSFYYSREAESVFLGREEDTVRRDARPATMIVERRC